MKAQIHTAADGRRAATNVCTEPCPIERGMRLMGVTSVDQLTPDRLRWR